MNIILELLKKHGGTNKRDLANMTLPNSNVDTAIPLAWSNKAREIGVKTNNFVMSYDDNAPYGTVVNVAERTLEHLLRQLSGDDAKTIRAEVFDYMKKWHEPDSYTSKESELSITRKEAELLVNWWHSAGEGLYPQEIKEGEVVINKILAFVQQK